MSIEIREYASEDLPAMREVWNEVVRSGSTFPQTDPLGAEEAAEFFAAQTYSAVAEETDTGRVLGLYILHPNNVGRCGHVANASFAVAGKSRGRRIGEKLVSDCLDQSASHGFRILQFNAVVASNVCAHHLYERLGFQVLGTLPGGFRHDDGSYEDTVLYYYEL